jgi:hypothetical protein
VVQIDLEVLVKALLPQVLLLELARLRVGRQKEDGLHEALTAILSDQIHHAPLHPALPRGVVDEVFRIKGLIILGREEMG